MSVGLLIEWIANVLGEDVARLVTPRDVEALRAVLHRALLIEELH